MAVKYIRGHKGSIRLNDYVKYARFMSLETCNGLSSFLGLKGSL